MARVAMSVDLSTLLESAISGNQQDIIAAVRAYAQAQEIADADVLIGRIGLAAAPGDADGHILITLTAAAMLARLLHTLPDPLDAAEPRQERALPLLVQALLVAAPALRLGRNVQPQYPRALYPSGLAEGQTVNSAMYDAIRHNDPVLAERLILGLYGTGADYRSMQVRTYDSIATTFQNNGHPLLCAVRGFQLLDAVEWGDRVPPIVHWLAPHLPLSPDTKEPDWLSTVRQFTTENAERITSIRKRLSLPHDEHALPLRQLILSDVTPAEICQGVYDALLQGKASPRAVASVIARAAADIALYVGGDNRERFVEAAHGFLFASAIRLVFQQVQDVEVLALLFTSAAFINALYRTVRTPHQQPQTSTASTTTAGGGLIAASQLEAFGSQVRASDISGALSTAQRYLKLGHDARALFATLGLVAATAANDDQGHTLQIVQAASEEFLGWPSTLERNDAEAFLLLAIRAAAFGQAR